MIPVYRPFFPSGASLEYAHNALRSSWVSSNGPYLEEADARLRAYFGVKHVVLTSSGTAAMHLAALALGWKHPNTFSLICPNNVYVAAWNAFLDTPYQLVMTDADEATWCISDRALHDRFDWIARLHGRTNGLALLAVHNVGGIVDVPKIQQRIRNRYGFDLPVIEDNCEGLLGQYGDRWTGTSCLASACSFYGNKSITSGEGGALFTNDDEIAEYTRRLSRQGQTDVLYVHNVRGYNYRMSNVAAAVLCGQLDLIEEIRTRKARIFARYRDACRSSGGRIFEQVSAVGTDSARWLFGVRIPGGTFESHRAIFETRGIQVRPMFSPASWHAHLRLRDNPRVQLGTETVATMLQRECVILPSYPDLSESDQDQIIEVLLEVAKKE